MFGIRNKVTGHFLAQAYDTEKGIYFLKVGGKVLFKTETHENVASILNGQCPDLGKKEQPMFSLDKDDFESAELQN